MVLDVAVLVLAIRHLGGAAGSGSRPAPHPVQSDACFSSRLQRRDRLLQLPRPRPSAPAAAASSLFFFAAPISFEAALRRACSCSAFMIAARGASRPVAVSLADCGVQPAPRSSRASKAPGFVANPFDVVHGGLSRSGIRAWSYSPRIWGVRCAPPWRGTAAGGSRSSQRSAAHLAGCGDTLPESLSPSEEEKWSAGSAPGRCACRRRLHRPSWRAGLSYAPSSEQARETCPEARASPQVTSLWWRAASLSRRCALARRSPTQRRAACGACQRAALSAARSAAVLRSRHDSERSRPRTAATRHVRRGFGDGIT